METVAFATVATGAIVAIIWKPKKHSRRSILLATVATVATGAIIWKPGLRWGSLSRFCQRVPVASGASPHNSGRNAISLQGVGVRLTSMHTEYFTDQRHKKETNTWRQISNTVISVWFVGFFQIESWMKNITWIGIHRLNILVSVLLHERTYQNSVFRPENLKYPITDQTKYFFPFTLIRPNVCPISDNQANCVPHFRPKRSENLTPKGGTYPYGHLMGIPPPPPRHQKGARCVH